MKLASIRADGRDRLAVALDDEHVIDLAEAVSLTDARGLPEVTFTDVLAFIEAGDAAISVAYESVAHALAHPRLHVRYPLSAVHWHAPVRRPSKIVCLALNNSANADRILSGPRHPAAFIKGANALAGHGEPIVIKPAYGRCHPEPELAVVIGRRATEIRADEALAYVFGYTIHNDITSPTMRAEDTFHYRAIHPREGDATAIDYVDTWVSYPARYKGSDTFSPMGPWLVTRDEVPDPHTLDVRCLHRGELVTEDNTANLFYKVPQVIEFLTQFMTLMPGDIVSMGTALRRAGTATRAVQNVDLARLGGPVSVQIERLGTLSNPVQLPRSG